MNLCVTRTLHLKISPLNIASVRGLRRGEKKLPLCHRADDCLTVRLMTYRFPLENIGVRVIERVERDIFTIKYNNYYGIIHSAMLHFC